MPINNLIYGYVVREEDYPDKSKIIDEGAKGDWAYVILQGKVKVKKKTSKGHVTIDTLKEGEIFGEMALFEIDVLGPFEETRGRRTATIVADGPVKVGILDKLKVLKEFESLSPQLKGLLKILVSRLAKTTQMAANMAVE